MSKLYTVVMTVLCIINIILGVVDYYNANVTSLFISSICGWLGAIIILATCNIRSSRD
jgi:hypothetical protein